MAKYFLTERDRAIVAEVVRRVTGGRGNNRPIARRRRQVIAGGSASSRLAHALIVRRVEAATVDIDEKSVMPGQGDSQSALILEHAGLSRDSAAGPDWRLTVKQEDDTSAPQPPEGEPWPKKNSTLPVLNYTPAVIAGTDSRPILCHGYIQTLSFISESAPYFIVTEFVRNSVVFGTTQWAVNGESFQTSNFDVVSGYARTSELATDGAIAIANHFQFEIPNNGKFMAMMDDYGNWRLVQAECPI